MDGYDKPVEVQMVSVCKESLQQDPFAGAVFMYRNRRGTAT